MWSIRSAVRADHAAVLALVRAAFTAPGHDADEEVTVVEDTWQRGGEVSGLELVATDEGAVLGYALGARGQVGTGTVVTVAPLAVAPARQRQGIGTALMTELVARADDQGWPAVVVLGDPGYYGRFGFEPATRAGMRYGPLDPEDPHFQVRRLRGFDPALRGLVRYCWETDPSDDRGGTGTAAEPGPGGEGGLAGPSPSGAA